MFKKTNLTIIAGIIEIFMAVIMIAWEEGVIRAEFKRLQELQTEFEQKMNMIKKELDLTPIEKASAAEKEE